MIPSSHSVNIEQKSICPARTNAFIIY